MTRSSNDEGQAITCPVCAANSAESVGAQGMVLSAAEALANGDVEQIKAAFENCQPYDFHIAVTMYVDAMIALADTLGLDFDSLLADQRRQLNELIKKQGSAGGS